MTEDEWSREVEAQWIQPADSYFPQDLIRECVDPSLTMAYEDGSSPKDADGEYYLGADFGKAQDHSAICRRKSCGFRGSGSILFSQEDL